MLARVWVALAAVRLFAQSTCPATPEWSPCDLTFDLETNESPDLRAEFRSPHHKTYLIYAFHDTGRRFVIRFSPTESGVWTYRVTSSVPRFDGKEGQLAANDSDSPGFIHVANVHHFAYDGTGKAHLWMAAPLDHFVTIPRADFDRAVAQLVDGKFTHVRVTLESGADLHETADRVRAINARGMVADIIFAAIPENTGDRAAYLADVVPRFAAFNVTWMGPPAFENLPHGRAVMKDTGAAIKRLDPYQHPRTGMAETTSAPMLGDGWMNLISYGTPDPNVGAVEHQLYQAPAINTSIKNERDLWTATMNGQYPASGSGQYMTAWFEFMSGNRYWELEPYFEVDGGRAIALEGVEYIVYVEKPGPVEVTVERHGYDVAWINPLTGERLKEKKGYSGEHFTGEAPDNSHPWVLHISREGTKEGMLKSWKFESRQVPVQEVETTPDKIPFDVASPAEGDVHLAAPPFFAIKVKRETRATRSLFILWTAEVVVDGEGYRVVGTGREGTMHIPRSIADNYPAVMVGHMIVLNANGKAYELDRVYRLLP